MEYELARELKEEGFPQTDGDFWVAGKVWDRTMQSDHTTPSTPNRNTWVKQPTLSELIEACGDDFYTLELKNGMFRRFEAHRNVYNEFGTGNSPEEAVASLWVALQKEKDTR